VRAIDHPLFWESVTLLLAVALFDAWERRRPGYAVNRRHHLRLNLLAIGIVIVFSEVWKVTTLALFGALDLRAALPFLAPVHGLPSPVKVFLAIALADLLLYAVHRAMHASDLLWRSHAFHHTTEQMFWLAGARTSVTHLLLFAVPQVLVVYHLVGLTPVEAAVGLSFGVLVNIWVHTNLRVSLGGVERWIVTPDFHRVHHAADRRSRMNLGFVFTVWDRLFGTYLDPRTVEPGFRLGIAGEQGPLLRRVVGV
jgi:sterol desaturase/sphingolipid hydroxylase (fatty acid hydroxylase superfamily)